MNRDVERERTGSPSTLGRVSEMDALADLYSRPHFNNSPAMFRLSMNPSTSAMPRLRSSARA